MTPFGKSIAAAVDVFEGITRRYGKPEWDVESTLIDGMSVPVRVDSAVHKPFCTLTHFSKDEWVANRFDDPKVLIVAPMSGHYATLLRGTVEAMLPEHDVYITDWIDSREIPDRVPTSSPYASRPSPSSPPPPSWPVMKTNSNRCR